MENKNALELSQRWVRQFVLKYNLCPFAHSVDAKDQIRYAVCQGTTEEQRYSFFMEELLWISESSPDTLATTLLIFPKGVEDFYFYLDFLENCEGLLEESESDFDFQLASFHPHYLFEGTEEDDLANYTNRSPYPMIHILRADEVEKAVEDHPNIDEVPERNQTLLRSLSKEVILSEWKIEPKIVS